MGAKRILILLLSFLLKASLFTPIKGQIIGNGNFGLIGQGDRRNTITTEVPFLRIVPDARAAGMGNAGVSISPDRNANFWNPSKLAFAQENVGVGASYVPWMKKLINEWDLGYLSGYFKPTEEQSIGVSARYFSWGDIHYRPPGRNRLRSYSAWEMMLSLGYSRKFGERSSFGLNAKYIHSDLAVPGMNRSPIQTLAADLSYFYTNDDVGFGDGGGSFNFGVNISNIGPKVSYLPDREGDFLPINLRLGPTFNIDFDQRHRLSISHQLSKLLVPSPPIYEIDNQGREQIIAGRNPNDIGVASGIFGSFSDAPGRPVRDDNGDIVFRNDGSGRARIQDGSKFEEELQEITVSTGVEYSFDQMAFFRMGYFYEHPNKGGRQFLTTGIGGHFGPIYVDLSYLHQFGSNNFLHQTVRVSLGAEF